MILQIDSQSQKAQAFVNGVLAGELALDLANVTTNPLGVGRVRFRSNSTNQLYPSGFALDNIVTSSTLSPIPEPSTMALATGALVAGGLLLRKQRPLR